MSKFFEASKNILYFGVVVMLLVYMVIYRKSCNELNDLRRENRILKRYLQQELFNSKDYVGDIYVI